MTGMPAVTLANHLRAMADRDLVDLPGTEEPESPPASAAITETGLHVLWHKTESISRIVTPTNDIPI